MDVNRRSAVGLMGLLAGSTALPAVASAAPGVSLSPEGWRADYDKFMARQLFDRTTAGTARGMRGAVTVAYGGLAARAGLEALKRGGSAMDAALTTAMAQIVLTAGAPVSFFGIQSLVCYDARTRRVHTMNGEWNTLIGETDPLSIPSTIGPATGPGGLLAGTPTGRGTLVGGFLKGVESAHNRFGRLPFQSLFDPSIYIAENGFPVSRELASQFAQRRPVLSRLPETRGTFLKPDGSDHVAGDIFRQPALARTLRRVAREGTGHVYGGDWGERLVRAVRADGGKLTIDDLRRYEVVWSDALVASIGNGWSVHASPPPNIGCGLLAEAQNLARVSGLADGPHWTASGAALAKAQDIAGQFAVEFMPPEMAQKLYPELDFSPESRLTEAHASKMWAAMQQGRKATQWLPGGPRSSDDVVAIDSEGNIVAITHSINAVYWGATGITIDGITVSDAAGLQQAEVARVKPGARLPAPTQTGILFRGADPVIGFASMGSGLHHRTFQCLLNVTAFGMDVAEAVNTADFFMPQIDAQGKATMLLPPGRFSHHVLNDSGYAWRELPLADIRMAEGKWVAIARDPTTGELQAASHNRSNSAALAF
jgi:gamma-glutamyltranspeptidase / glutathione hydrolase